MDFTLTTMYDDVVFSDIKSVSDAQVLRRIRNECKDFMTRSTEYITEEKQAEWFNKLDRDNIKLYLMWIAHHGVAFEVIGFGYCKKDETETYLTGGLKEELRGKGYGKVLFSHLLTQAKSFNTPITLEVLKTNERAKRLYESLGFSEISSDDRIIKMEYRNDSAV